MPENDFTGWRTWPDGSGKVTDNRIGSGSGDAPISGGSSNREGWEGF